MSASPERGRLAVAAPALHLMIGGLSLALAARPETLMIPMLVAALLVPLLVGWWVFAGRPALSRALLATWAPAGELVLLVLIVLALRPSGISQALFIGLVAGPMLVLLVLGLLALRGQGRGVRVAAAVLWILALAEVAAAIPLSDRFGSTEDMQAITGIVILLLVPAAALGAWSGLAVAAVIPEPERPRPTASADDDAQGVTGSPEAAPGPEQGPSREAEAE